jgi:hypothetical protein
MFSSIYVMHINRWYYWLCPELSVYMQLHIYCSIIVAFLSSFCCGVNYMIKMMFAVNLVYSKVVDNLFILLMLNFHGNSWS